MAAEAGSSDWIMGTELGWRETAYEPRKGWYDLAGRVGEVAGVKGSCWRWGLRVQHEVGGVSPDAPTLQPFQLVIAAGVGEQAVCSGSGEVAAAGAGSYGLLRRVLSGAWYTSGM